MLSSSVCETIPESHASLGALEGWHSLLQGQIRASRLDVEDRFGSIVSVTHQCVPWLVRHAGCLLNRFQCRQNAWTAFENLKGVSHKKKHRCNLVNDVTGWRLNESRTNMILVGELEFGWDDTLHQTHT